MSVDFGIRAILALLLVVFFLVWLRKWLDESYKKNETTIFTTGVVIALILTSLFILWDYKRSQHVKTPPIIIQEQQSIGNLKQRALQLSEEIMEDPFLYGWRGSREMPTGGEELIRRLESRSRYFKWKFYQRVVEIRDELALFHRKDKYLDDFIERQQTYEQIKNQVNLPERQFAILPQEIESVAERLRLLAEQIDD